MVRPIEQLAKSSVAEVDVEVADADLMTTVLDVHRSFPTGVTIVTTFVGGKPYGLAVNAFSSISIEPPVVLVCVAKTSATHDLLYAGDSIAVNILANDQLGVAKRFAKSGGDKFTGLALVEGLSGAPILAGVSAHLELIIERRIVAYTHTIFIGRVVGAGTSERPPLVYLGGKFYDGEQLALLS